MTLDCALAHCHYSVAATADLLNIRLVYVPAKLTFMLQPLDVRGFASYKVVLKRALLAAEAADGHVLPERWAAAVSSLVRDFWRARLWRPSFEACGFYPHRQQLTADLRCLKIPRARTVPVSMPLPEDIQDLLLRHRMVSQYVLFHRISGAPRWPGDARPRRASSPPCRCRPWPSRGGGQRPTGARQLRKKMAALEFFSLHFQKGARPPQHSIARGDYSTGIISSTIM